MEILFCCNLKRSRKTAEKIVADSPTLSRYFFRIGACPKNYLFEISPGTEIIINKKSRQFLIGFCTLNWFVRAHKPRQIYLKYVLLCYQLQLKQLLLTPLYKLGEHDKYVQYLLLKHGIP